MFWTLWPAESFPTAIAPSSNRSFIPCSMVMSTCCSPTISPTSTARTASAPPTRTRRRGRKCRFSTSPASASSPPTAPSATIAPISGKPGRSRFSSSRNDHSVATCLGGKALVQFLGPSVVQPLERCIVLAALGCKAQSIHILHANLLHLRLRH